VKAPAAQQVEREAIVESIVIDADNREFEAEFGDAAELQALRTVTLRAIQPANGGDSARNGS
jgi:hypothetical protein